MTQFMDFAHLIVGEVIAVVFFAAGWYAKGRWGTQVAAVVAS